MLSGQPSPAARVCHGRDAQINRPVAASQHSSVPLEDRRVLPEVETCEAARRVSL